jgi:hypothetical protein
MSFLRFLFAAKSARENERRRWKGTRRYFSRDRMYRGGLLLKIHFYSFRPEISVLCVLFMFGTCFVFFPPASWRLAEQILVCGSMRNVSVSVNLRTATTFLVLRKRRKQACNILAREDLLSRRFDRAGSYGFIRWAINRELSGRVELFELHFLLAGFICF